MRAAIYNGKKNILLGELKTPKAGDFDIVVKNLYASICGTDVAVYSHGPGTGHRIICCCRIRNGMSRYFAMINKSVRSLEQSRLLLIK